MIKKQTNIPLFGLGLLLIVLIISNLQSIQASTNMFNNISGIEIRKENGTSFIIDPLYFLDYDPPKVLRNIDAEEKNLTLDKKESITISYESPCGVPDTITGIFVDGKVSVVSDGKYQELDIKGSQKEFYENSLPSRNGTDMVSIPNDLKAGDYEFLILMDCDDTIHYYISNATIKS